MGKTTETKTPAGETAAPAAETTAAAGETTTAGAETPAPLPVDDYHGVGGSYVVEGGVRRRVAGPPLPAETPAA